MAGRKNKYITHVQPNLKKIQNWCRDGLTEDVIIRKIGVGHTAFNEYKKKYPELLKALRNGKQEVDYMVENAMLKNALGGKRTEERPVKLKKKYIDKNGNAVEEEFVKVVTLEKDVKGDTVAQIFWLKNRSSGKWKDRQDINHSGEMKIDHDKKAMSLQELEHRKKELLKRKK